MSNQEHAIEAKDLRKTFGATTAVDGIDFTVKAGSVTALLGGNGAGKTTTISILLGLLLPTSGEIRVLGRDILRDRFNALHLMNFSSPYVDLPNRLTVRQNLTVYGNLYNVPRLKARIDEMAEQLQLSDLLDRAHGSLSAGQKTRATLAKALLNKPQLLLLDEPTASLDPDTADWVRTLLMDYQKEARTTIFMASHNMYEVERMADDVIMMRQGRIVDRGSPRYLLETYERDNLEEVFLDIARDRNLEI
jgi:ABC-2 type transport system ATP-binding protein